jgi:hypothetical protein
MTCMKLLSSHSRMTFSCLLIVHLVKPVRVLTSKLHILIPSLLSVGDAPPQRQLRLDAQQRYHHLRSTSPNSLFT